MTNTKVKIQVNGVVDVQKNTKSNRKKLSGDSNLPGLYLSNFNKGGRLSARPEGPRAGEGFLGRGQRGGPPPHQLGGLGERCKLPQRGPGRSPGKF